MYEYIKTWLELKTDRRAVTALEYGLIAAAVVAVGLAGFSVIGTNLAAKFTNVKAALT
jgi:pilus assembly protein Flp/PilA